MVLFAESSPDPVQLNRIRLIVWRSARQGDITFSYGWHAAATTASVKVARRGNDTGFSARCTRPTVDSEGHEHDRFVTHGEFVAPHAEPLDVAQRLAFGQRERDVLLSVPPQRLRPVEQHFQFQRFSVQGLANAFVRFFFYLAKIVFGRFVTTRLRKSGLGFVSPIQSE